MTTLVLGLALFLGLHSLPMFRGLRDALVANLGERRYKGVFSLGSLAGIILIVAGFMLADPRERLFAPWPEARVIAPYGMTIAFVLFAAANMRSHLRSALKHPMLLGLVLWSGVHLLANGDRRGTVLFGAFLAWALVDLLSVTSRGATKSFTPDIKRDAMAVVGGVVLALVTMAVHRVLFGPAVVSFGL